MNKVRWSKEHLYSEATVEVFENGQWINYRNSKLFLPDGEFSKGYRTFLNALIKGYTVEKLKVKSELAQNS